MLGLDNPLHVVFLLLVLLLVFGAKRLPELGASLGSGLRGFKDALSTEERGHAQLAPPADETIGHADDFSAGEPAPAQSSE